MVQIDIALLADSAVHNLARRLAYRLVTTFGADLYDVLPPHVSLKHGFTVPELEAVEAWLEGFCASIAPFEVAFDRIYYQEWEGSAIIGLAAVENAMLRELHNRLNRELGALFGDVSAPFDGPEFCFHLTVAMGVADNPVYRRFYDTLESKELDLRFTARQLELFVELGTISSTTYLDYRTYDLG